jgi:type I restriction enzyme S subunit
VYISIAGTIGRVGVVPDDLSGANLTENAAKITEISDDVDHRYLMYYLRSPIGQGAIKNRTGGTSQPKLALYRIADIDFLCPPLAIQRRIASILSAYDDLIENNRRRIQLLEQAARLLYKEWFVHLRFPGHEYVKIKNGVPEGWRPATIATIGEVVTGKTPSKKKEPYYGDKIPFIKTPDMHGNTLIIKTHESLSEEGANTQSNKTLPPRSILVSCIGTVGAVSFNSSEAQTNQQINAIVLTDESLRYWTFFMAKDLKPLLEGMGGGATMANVNKSKFSSIKVVVPSALMIDQFNSFVATQID